MEELPMKNPQDRNPINHPAPNDAPPATSVPAHDGIDRRNFLSCMAWAGTGLVWTISGGVPTARLFAASAKDISATSASSFSFVQISDSHIGFNKAANQDVTGTLKLAIDKINHLPTEPELLLHTGDITQSSKPGNSYRAANHSDGARRSDLLGTWRA
jgi:3',5'-cyclic-AMP phosphodiesterase